MSQNLDRSMSSEEEKETSKQQHNNISDSIQPTHEEKKNLGIVQSHTNYSTEANASQKNDQEIRPENISKADINSTNNQDTTLNKQNIQPIQIKKQVIQPIKTQQASIQTGVTQKNQILPSVEQTYVPQHCEVRSKPVEIQSKPTDIKSQSLPNDEGEKKTQQQVQIQVGVSSLNQPQKVINKAKQQRILENYLRFQKFMQDNKTHSENQKTVLLSVFQQIEKKKMQQYSWYSTLRQYFNQYAGFTKQFFEKCQKAPKQQKVDQMNKFLNIGEQLRAGFSQLVEFKRQTGDNYKKMYEYITTKVIKDLEQIYNKYINQMNVAQGLTNEKKKQCLKQEQEFKKQGWKVQKIFTRVKQGKKQKQQQDFFVQITKLINLQKHFRDALILWGKQVVQLKKSLVDLTQACTIDIQHLLNSFKTQSNCLYGIQKSKYERVIKSRDEIVQDTKFSKLITLTDADYIRYSRETSLKKQVIEITDENFIQFVEMPQMEKLLVKPDDLLHNLIVKIFNLKDDNTQLVNTISGNLVLFNKQNSQSVDRISLKNIKQAVPMEEGTIQIKQKVPGIIFNSKKVTKFQFKDGDRAEQLICFLSHAESNDK